MKILFHILLGLLIAAPAMADNKVTTMGIGGKSYSVIILEDYNYKDAIEKLNPMLAPVVLDSCSTVISMPGGFNQETQHYAALCTASANGKTRKVQLCVNMGSGLYDMRAAGSAMKVYDLAKYTIVRCMDKKG